MVHRHAIAEDDDPFGCRALLHMLGAAHKVEQLVGKVIAIVVNRCQIVDVTLFQQLFHAVAQTRQLAAILF